MFNWQVALLIILVAIGINQLIPLSSTKEYMSGYQRPRPDNMSKSLNGKQNINASRTMA